MDDSYRYQLEALKIEGEVAQIEANILKEQHKYLDIERQKAVILKQIETYRESVTARKATILELQANHGSLQTPLP